jgi:hypothetical protein
MRYGCVTLIFGKADPKLTVNYDKIAPGVADYYRDDIGAYNT